MKKLFFSVSAISTASLIFSRNIIYSIFIYIFFAAVLFFYYKITGNLELSNISNETPSYLLIISFLVDFLLSFDFYNRFNRSSTIQRIANGIGLSRPFLLIPFCIVAFILSYFYIFSICKSLFDYLKDNETEISNELISKIKKISILLIIIGVFSLFLFSFTENIWNDEAFSLALIKNDFLEIIKLDAMDVHPPLYYLITKTFTFIISSLIPNLNIIYIAKLNSLIPILLLLIINFTIIKKEFGINTSIFFSLCCIGMPGLIDHILEIRMYSWGAFFVFSSYISAYFINKNINNNKYWVLFILSSLCASYTHYYALVSIVFIYLYVLYISIKNKKIIKWLLFSAVTILLYLPWVIVFVNQTIKVSKNYWIKQITLSNINDYFSTSFGNIIFFIIVLTIFLCLKNKNNYHYNLGILLPLLVTTTGLVASIIITPVFVPRYMVMTLPCLWFGLTAQIFKNDSKKVILAFIISISCFFAINIAIFTTNEIIAIKHDKKLKTFLETTNEAIYMCDETNSVNTLSYIVNNKIVFYNGSRSGAHEYLFNNCLYTNIDSFIETNLKNGKEFYLLDYEKDSIKQEIEKKYDVTLEYIDKYKVDLELNIYKMDFNN